MKNTKIAHWNAEGFVQILKRSQLGQSVTHKFKQTPKEGEEMTIEHYLIIRGPEGEREINLNDLSKEKRREITNALNIRMLGQLNYVPEKTA